LSFAAADVITIIASINYASRATELSVAVPLLVSFDFLTKFSTQILDSIKRSDDESERAVESYFYSDSKRECSLLFVVLPVVAGIAVTGVVLAILSIGIN
jgi:hypothetical protein